MYGSSLMRVTLRPRDSRIAAREAEAIPLPREDTTPPVTKTNLVMSGSEVGVPVVKRDYRRGSSRLRALQRRTRSAISTSPDQVRQPQPQRRHIGYDQQ